MCFSVLAIVTGACHKINQYLNLPDDNALEQRVEDIVEEETGVKIDLTLENKDAAIERKE